MKDRRAERFMIRSRRKAFKTNVWFWLGIVAFVAAIGLVGAQDKRDAELKQASITCQTQLYNSTPTLQQCINNQLERNNDK